MLVRQNLAQCLDFVGCKISTRGDTKNGCNITNDNTAKKNEIELFEYLRFAKTQLRFTSTKYRMLMKD